MDDPKVFNLLADHVALDFINTLDDRFAPGGPVEKLELYTDLLAFAQQSRLLAPAQTRSLAKLANAGPGDQTLKAGVDLREVLARVFYSVARQECVADQDMAQLNKTIRQAASHRVLAFEETDFIWRWEGLDKKLEAPVWLIVQSAADLLSSPDVRFVRECGREGCRWLFLDLSKNHSRRWCDMKVCGNRVKASRFYALHGRD